MAGSRQVGIDVPRIEDSLRPIDRAVQYLLGGGIEKITCLITGSFFLRDIAQLVASTLPQAVSITKCKKRSMMLPEIERIGVNSLAGHLKPSDFRGRVFSVQTMASAQQSNPAFGTKR